MSSAQTYLTEAESKLAAASTAVKAAESSLTTALSDFAGALADVKLAVEAISPSGPVPNAPLGGTWNLVFADEFNGTQVNTSVWSEHDGWTNQNGVTDHASNVSEAGGNLILKLVSNTSGAAVAGSTSFSVGQYIEARVQFQGSGTSISDWPAWWVSGPNWPAAGENDIAEGLGTLTVNYHSPSGAHNMGTIPGDWANGFHTYGLHRKATGCDVYWDGQLVKSYGTDDNGQPQHPILTIGYGGGTFVPAQLLVDYVRVWSPA